MRLAANPPDRTKRTHPAEYETRYADEGIDDIAVATLTALTNGFLTGASIPVDGGEHLVQKKGSDMHAIHHRYAGISARNPARRIGTPEDIAQGVLFALANTFLTGQTLHIDGGEPLT